MGVDPLNLIVCGVGGQGNILVSDLLSRAACREGYEVSVGETFGATQRGGSVMSHIRLSRNHAYGPLIPSWAAHIIMGFEPLEAYRTLRAYGNESVRVLVNDRPVYPLDALNKRTSYPDMDRLLGWLEELSAELRVVKATDLAREAGDPKTQNVVMTGALIALKWIPLSWESCLVALHEIFSGEKLRLNQRAMELGYSEMSRGI